MKAINTNDVEMANALGETNKAFEDNVIWNRYEHIGNQIHFTLRVKSSKGKGARLGFTGRHLISACWHIHGTFFDELLKINPKAIIRSSMATITVDGGNWQDKNIGSIMSPLYYSDACGCGA